MFYSAEKNLIIALDTPDLIKTLEICKKVKGQVYAIKLGLEFFMANGIDGVVKVKEIGVRIFLDLKFYDIPNTVAKAVREISKINIDMLTIHISGGREMIKRALDEANNSTSKALIIGVSILTSLDIFDLKEIGYQSDLNKQIKQMISLATNTGIQAVVCSAYEIELIKKQNSDLKLIVPAIRFTNEIITNNTIIDDQKRVMSPKKALKLGATYLVMGRSITKNDNILKNIGYFNQEVAS